MEYKLPNEWYDVLKWIGLVVCPALATFYGVVAPLWGWPAPENTVTTINAIGVLIGALIGYSAITAKPEEEPEDDSDLIGYSAINAKPEEEPEDDADEM